jgi:hypothetical protein
MDANNNVTATCLGCNRPMGEHPRAECKAYLVGSCEEISGSEYIDGKAGVAERTTGNRHIEAMLLRPKALEFLHDKPIWQVSRDTLVKYLAEFAMLAVEAAARDEAICDLKESAPASQTARSQRPVAYACPSRCGCIWRDNEDGTMSLFGPNSKSCLVCEFLPLTRLVPLYDGEAIDAATCDGLERQPRRADGSFVCPTNCPCGCHGEQQP